MENQEKTENNIVETPATEETAPKSEGPSFAEAVVESKEAIEAAEPVKRRPGRPKKDASDQTSKPSKKAAGKAEVLPPAPTPPPVYLKSVVNFPFRAAALKSGWAGWELTEREQDENAIFLDAVLKRYLPQLQSEHAELVGLSLGIGMAAVSRYMAFAALVAQAQAQAEPNRSGDVVQDEQPQPQARPSKLEKIANQKKGKETDPAVKPGSGLASFLDNAQNQPQI